MKTSRKSHQGWKWPLVALVFFSLVGGSIALAKVKPTNVQGLPPEENNIVTVAGGGLDSGDGGLAVSADLTIPSNVAFDSVGNMFIAETSTLQFPPSPSHHRIRKVDKTTGIITTVAGTGVMGNSGDGEAATAARIAGPVRVTFDHSGNLYINGGGGGPSIRKVTPGNNGVIDGLVLKPISGCPAPTSESVTIGATDLCRDPDEDITTVVGNGAGCPPTDPDFPSCGDGGPATLASITGALRGSLFDAAGNFYFSDANHRIRKVTPGTNGVLDGLVLQSPLGSCTAPMEIVAGTNLCRDPGEIITAFAGTGFAGYAVKCSHNTELACTTHSDCGAGNTCSVGDGIPALEARFNSPRGLEFDASEANMYIAETGNHRIRKVHMATGIITTVVGNGVACNPANAPCGDGDPASAAQIVNPTSVSFNSLGNLYITLSNHRVRKVDTAGIITTIAGDGVAGFSGDGGPAELARFNMLRGSSMDSWDNFYIPDVINSRIRRLNLATPVTVDPLEEDERWVKATLQFPAGWNASDVNLDSIRLQVIDPANGAVRHLNKEVLQTAMDPGAPVGPTHEGGPNRRWFKFDRETVASWTTCGEDLALRVEGQFLNGRYFSGDTAIEVNCP